MLLSTSDQYRHTHTRYMVHGITKYDVIIINRHTQHVHGLIQIEQSVNYIKSLSTCNTRPMGTLSFS